MIDLNRWLNQEIGIPYDSDDEGNEAEPEEPTRREWRFD